jgi:tRNA-dihydrouridine synthase A
MTQQRLKKNYSRKISIAPMMDWTDRHCRYFLRLITKQSLLYTEMVNANAIVHGNALHLLTYNPEEHPVALQLGGNEPEVLAKAAKVGADYGYNEINLNVGCPSDRVQSGHFGACLMLQPGLVRDCVAAMQAEVDIPVTVKCRIGIDKEESYDFLKKFVMTVRESGCETFIIHARNAWLNGLSPKENRTIPPLRYDIVYQLKQEFPDLEIIINGGITTYQQIDAHLQHVDGVMLGREAYHNPYFLSEMDQRYYQDSHDMLLREDIVNNMLPYIANQREQDIFLKHITRHMLGLFHGQPGAKQWRRYLSEYAINKDAGIDVVNHALSLVEES